MKREIILTADGSHSLRVTDWQENYHSQHGAVQESMHVYIQAGLMPLITAGKVSINVFEMGFGTGLNAYLTLLKAQELSIKISYEAVEADPLQADEYAVLNYADQNEEHHLLFQQLHKSVWGKSVEITPHFTLVKLTQSLEEYTGTGLFDVVFYDAFAPTVQPDLWSTEVFEKMASILSEEGVLVTYCSKGNVQRALKAAGFVVAKLAGPPGKREIIRATKAKTNKSV